MENLIIRSLSTEDAPELSALLCRQELEYLRYFSPFSFDEINIQNILSRAKKDIYMGFFIENHLFGFFMLRGWDDGYKIPSYGVLIDQHYRGKGFATLSLYLAQTRCRLINVDCIMLKVDSRNIRAKHIYEKAGFTPTGVDPKNNNIIYNLKF